VRILLIDDEPDIRMIARMSLSVLGGMEVTEAASGAEGIARAREWRPDAILLDMMMPSLDGAGTLARLQADPSTSSIPVIFLTAKAMTSEVERLQGLGAAGVLTKPFDPETLAAQVSAILGRR